MSFSLKPAWPFLLFFFMTIAIVIVIAIAPASALAQSSSWSATQIEMAAPDSAGLGWFPAPAYLGTTSLAQTALRVSASTGGAWCGVLPYLRITEPPVTSPQHLAWATLAIDFPWLVAYHWESGQVPPEGPYPTTADLLNAVGLGDRVNVNDVDALSLGPNMAAPTAIAKFVDTVLAACRHHALPIIDPSIPLDFDPTHGDWLFDHYGYGSSPAADHWLNATKSGTVVNGNPVTGLVPSRMAEVALAYTAPDAAEFSAAVRRMNEIEDVGYEVWMHILVFAPDECVTTPQSYAETGAVPELDEGMAAESLRFDMSSAVVWHATPNLGVQHTIEADPKASAGSSGAGAPQVFIPVPMSSIDMLEVEIPLAAGGSTTVMSSRHPFEPGFTVTTPPLSQLHPTLDWSLSYPSTSPWPGFPLAPMANPVASGILQ